MCLVTTGSQCPGQHQAPNRTMDSMTEIHMAWKAWPCESFIHLANIYQHPHPTVGCLACVREALAWPAVKGPQV